MLRRSIGNFPSDSTPAFFKEYLKNKLNPEVSAFLEQLSSLSKVLIFSGVIRDFYIGYNGPIRDLDIVIDGDTGRIENFLENFHFSKNSFGGYKFTIGGQNVDLWHIKTTWAFSHLKVRPQLFDEFSLPDTAFFNFSSIIYDYTASKFIKSKHFDKFLERGELDIVLEDNPLPQLCVINTIYYTEKFQLKISNSLKKYFVKNFDKFTEEEFGSIQLKHFHRIRYRYDILKYYRNSFQKELCKTTYNITKERSPRSTKFSKCSHKLTTLELTL